MKTIINLNSKSAESDLLVFKMKKHEIDIKIENVHLKDMNRLTGINLFSKNDVFVRGETLYAAMQPKGEDEHHNYHDLKPKDVLGVFKSIAKPYCILKTERNRVAIITSFVSHLGEPVNVIIELGAGLETNKDANINKVVTMYAITKVNKFIEKYGSDSILYLKIGNKVKQKA